MTHGARAGTRRVAVVVAAAVAAGVLTAAAGTRAGHAAEGTSGEDTTAEAEAMLWRARQATASPHSGSVTVVSFTDRGPRVAQLEVTVTGDEVRLERPARIILDPQDEVDEQDLVADVEAGQTVPTAPLGLDVEAVLDRWQVTIGRTVVLDTGPAVPLHLVRTRGTAVRETLFLDEATDIPVRRETRDADGRVLRVVAYTSLDVDDTDDATGARASGRLLAARTGMAVGLLDAASAGFEVLRSLEGGFELVTVATLVGGGDEEVVVARYSDGLSVLSVYQLRGWLDTEALDGAQIHHVADRDVFTWPGREPLRYVWTGADRTWTAVSDAPAPVIEDALETLPGDLVGHDATHRVRRGLDRVWQLVTEPLR